MAYKLICNVSYLEDEKTLQKVHFMQFDFLVDL